MGGAGAVMGASIKQVKVICWEDLGCEAVRELQVENMPLMVAIDSRGGNIYESGPAEYLKSIRENGEK
jgi:fumarate hydratase subunit beta